MFRPVNYFFLGSILLFVILYRRDPRNREAFLALLKDQKAMTFGVLAMTLALVTNLVDHGFHDVLNLVIQAILFGFAVAAIFNWFHRRKQGSNSR